MVKDMSSQLREALEVEYSTNPDNGTVYYKIRQFQGAYDLKSKNQFLEHLWWTRAEKGETRARLNQVMKSENGDFQVAFDSLRHLPALHNGMILGLMGHILQTKCREVECALRPPRTSN